jgi:hypothetical protein
MLDGWTRLMLEVFSGHRVTGGRSIDHVSSLFLYPIGQQWLELWLVRPNEHAGCIPNVQALRDAGRFRDGMRRASGENQETWQSDQ